MSAGIGGTSGLPPFGQDKLQPFGLVAAPLLAALHGEAFADPDLAGPPWDARAFADLLSLPGTIALVAPGDPTPAQAGNGGEEAPREAPQEAPQEAPLGLVLLRVAADEGEILTIGTRPAARRRGIAGRLLAGAAAWAAGSGATRLFLEVAATNLPARALYAAHGFREVGRRRSYYRLAGQPVDALILARDLPNDGETAGP